jgi:hypothetical protein
MRNDLEQPRPRRGVRLLLAVLAMAAAAACGPTIMPEPPPQPLPPATVPAGADEAARRFVLGFLDARVAGDAAAARAYLSPQAAEQYAAGEGGLRLVPSSQVPFTAGSLLEQNAADADSYEMRVRIESSGGGFEEYLFVGPGPGPDGEQREWTIRGAQRIGG